MKRLLSFLLLSAAAIFAQCPTAPVFPGAVATSANLMVAGNQVQTTLLVGMASTDLVAVVKSGVGWVQYMPASVDSEILYVTGVNGNILTVSRACEGTSAVTHAAGAAIANNVTAGSHNLLGLELEAAETAIITATPIVSSLRYNNGGTTTAGVQEAFNACTGPCTVVMPAGDFTWSTPVTTPAITTTAAHGYALVGQGAKTTRINIAGTFPLASSGIIIAGSDHIGDHSKSGITVSDLGFILAQPFASGSLAAFTRYPPVIYSVGLQGTHLNHLYISGAWKIFYDHGYPDGVNTIGVGQEHIDDVQVSAFGPGGFDLDGCDDPTYIHNLHYFPFTDGVSSTLTTDQPMMTAAAIAFKIGTCGPMISDSTVNVGTLAQFVSNGGATFSHSNLDTFASIQMSPTGYTSLHIGDGTTIFQDGSFGTVNCSQPWLAEPGPGITGNYSFNVQIADSFITRNCATQNLISIIAGPAASVQNNFEFIGNIVNDGTNTASVPSLLYFNDATNGTPIQITIAHNSIAYTGVQTYANPMLTCNSCGYSSLTLDANKNTGVGSGVWYSLTGDNDHRIFFNNINNVQGNPGGTWTATLPTAHVIGVYADKGYNFDGSLGLPFVNSTSGTTVLTGVSLPIVCIATTGNQQYNLPFAANNPKATFWLTKTDASGNTCAFATSSDTIVPSGHGTLSTQNATVELVSDGVSKWYQH